MDNKIYKVEITLHNSTPVYNVRKVDFSIVVDESNESNDNYSEINTILDNNSNVIRWYTFSSQENIDLTKQTLMNHIQSKIGEYKSSLNPTMLEFPTLTKFLQNG